MNNMDTKKEELYLSVQMPHTPGCHIVVFSDVNEGLKEEMHNVCDVDEVTCVLCAYMEVDEYLVEKLFDPFWHYYFSYAYFRIRGVKGVSLMDFYETCKSILRLFKDNWFGCDDDKKQRRYESALELLEGWKAEMEKMDESDSSLLFKDVPQRRKTNARGWEKLLGPLDSKSGNMEGWEKLLGSQNSESGNIKGLEKLPGQEKSDTDKCEKLTIDQHLAKVYCEFYAIWKENPQVRRYVEEQGGEASFEALGRFLDKANETPPSNGKKIKSKKRKEEANFSDLLQYLDKEKLRKRLHDLIDGKAGAEVGCVLLNAYKFHYITRRPTRAEFESEFKLIGSWSAISNYMNEENNKALDRARNIVIFPDGEKISPLW